MDQFIKMNGTGNDFIIFNGRLSPVCLENKEIIAIADRNNIDTGGCDQVIIIENSTKADCFMRIYNADGSEVKACGNASRCIGWLISRETNRDTVTIETLAGVLEATVSDFFVAVDMGKAKFGWKDIPLSHEIDTLHLGITEGNLHDPVGVSMGNPHAVFFVENVDSVDLDKLGSKLEYNPIFPEKANIGVAEIISDAHIKLRVFERGVGETLACGTGASAALVAANRRCLAERAAKISVKGGELFVEWCKDDHVILSGSVSISSEMREFPSVCH